MGNSVKPSNLIIGIAMAEKQEGFDGRLYTWGKGISISGPGPGYMWQINIDPGYYYHVAVYDGNNGVERWVANTNGYASSATNFRVTGGSHIASIGVVMTSNYPIF